MRRQVSIILMVMIAAMSVAAPLEKKDVAYIDAPVDEYQAERCRLDVYAPDGAQGLPVVVFFHGGGLEGGNKFIPTELKDKGIVVVAPNYRLSPRATAPAYIEDAAAAVAWTIRNAAAIGGDAKRVYVTGHSAGGYLTLMLALDKSYLAKHDIDADSLAGYIPLSGQTNTHYTIRKERGLDMAIPMIDKYAPLYHARKLIPPMILVTGARKQEMTSRFTENLHLQETMQVKGARVELYELDGFDHGTMFEPGCLFVLRMIRQHSGK